jgi:hypothetical protein
MVIFCLLVHAESYQDCARSGVKEPARKSSSARGRRQHVRAKMLYLRKTDIPYK